MEAMSDRDEFLEWFDTTWREAEVALHNGDAAPRFDTWSDQEPVTLFGAWLQASGPADVRAVFKKLEEAFGGSVSSSVEVVAADTRGDLAYTAHRELTSATVNGEQRDYVLRVTQVYRRENGEWKVVHRHADEESGPADGA